MLIYIQHLLYLFQTKFTCPQAFELHTLVSLCLHCFAVVLKNDSTEDRCLFKSPMCADRTSLLYKADTGLSELQSQHR